MEDLDLGQFTSRVSTFRLFRFPLFFSVYSSLFYNNQDLGSSSLSITAHAVAHDTCHDVWYVSGSIDADWGMDQFEFTSINFTFIGMCELPYGIFTITYRVEGQKLSLNSSYIWDGFLTGTAIVPGLDITTSVSIKFNSQVFHCSLYLFLALFLVSLFSA